MTKWITLVVRILLGGLFAFSGFTKFVPIVPQSMDGMPAEAVAFATALGESGYIMPLVAAVEVVAGLMLLTNRFVPLGLTLLAPIVVGIVGFHVFLAPSGVVMVLVIAVMEVYLAWAYWSAFAPMLQPRAGSLASATSSSGADSRHASNTSSSSSSASTPSR